MSEALKPVVLDHPLVRHKLTRLRDRDTSTAGFRRLTRELSLLLAYEATRNLTTCPKTVHVQSGLMEGEELDGKKLCFVSILRAGNGLLDGMLDLVPSARVGHIGLRRDHETLEVSEYYFNMPGDVPGRTCIVLDPMLATGHSAAAAITRVKAAGAQNPVFACLLAAPEGIRYMAELHPDVQVVTCAVDDRLDENGYIVPGLGDAGDRLFGTR
ncbi:uracil phosphoribosyltransferase [Gluconobacter wancherniae]|uniref:Uracil phosphoribosyltransferase n=1 Tax=Gluconobacter wancherniae NBRC 103581 TaxID=656744 RepID=A0A511B1F2_9PROT|nr:uracil phosphoribosyltransferase [Gluconobacter wancherniae]MBF0853899.1 uracil phosphoribosyltransferase [Gluconobacter wancherniae]MBS1062285.1 uracil phosphoribosyltransferase [Gluconobacter wancherniae]MBS1089159.1 uracil phosphoribosyltransferase [Gluconobacter wancherniae]GBD56954.1 uracil phosphoribosyltransferase [Gluconobacter wancherniae NBRC 103581]GBR64886.1 uracil phosphoribosyltransferase [Gluconobacter wancherniae NBRC 103581]